MRHRERNVGAHPLLVISGDPARLDVGVAATAAIVPTHYAPAERVADILRRLGKPAAAQFVEGKLRTSKSIRAGDLGEIFATEWTASQGNYQVPIRRLRWKDHRNMSVRGDDVIGIHQDPQTNHFFFLKTRAKSRVALSTAVLAEARVSLDKDGGLPSAHALSFIADRLAELGNNAFSNTVLNAQLKHGIQAQSVQHLTFAFSSNNPRPHQAGSLGAYAGRIAQSSVGLRIEGHATFVAAVYDLVIANANNWKHPGRY